MAQIRIAQRITCSGCDKTWTGTASCHCAGCHRTFSGIGLFDRHRRGGACVDPDGWGEGTARLVDGTWRGPEWDASKVFSR